MRKITLLIAGVLTGFTVDAQLALSGTNYSQDFDNIASGLPQGWEVYTAASATSLGTPATLNPAQVAWGQTSGGFKNFAAADGLTAASTGTDQNNATDRALGVRQVAQGNANFPNSNPGAAFVLHIANTNGLSGFTMSFKVQSLDETSGQTTTWTVDYGLGTSPSSFIAATPAGILTTGNLLFSNNTVTVNFGNALDNQSGPVRIRIVALMTTTGTGNRASTGIDDISLSWNGSGAPGYRPVITALAPADNSSNAGTSGNLSVIFDRQVQKGTGNIYVRDETAQTTQTIAVSTSNVAVSGNTVTIGGVTLTAGSMYHVLFDSSAFDTAGYRSYGIYDTTGWNFATAALPPPPATSLNENFDASCGAAPSNLPSGWIRYSVTGAQQWNCTGFGYSSTPAAAMNGYQGGNNENEDWLITPALDLSAMADVYLQFRAFKKFAGTDLEVMVSGNYTSGDPLAASVTWTDLNVDFTAVDTNWQRFEANLAPYKAQPLHIAFRYTSTASDGAQWKLDGIETSATSGVPGFNKASLPFAVIGIAATNAITLGYDLKEAGRYQVSIYDLTGRKHYDNILDVQRGTQRTTISGLDLAPGIYVIKLGNGTSFGIAKAIVQ